MNPALYLFVNKGLGMSPGKIAAQVAQATVGALNASDLEMVKEWWNGPGFHHAVYVMQARDTEHLHSLERYLNERGFRTFMMIDEGMTEIPAITPTVLGVEIVDKDHEHVLASFMTFELYTEEAPETPQYASMNESRLRHHLTGAIPRSVVGESSVPKCPECRSDVMTFRDQWACFDPDCMYA